MLAAFGIVIQVDDILREKRIGIETILCIPDFMMVIATQSRKALLIGKVIFVEDVSRIVMFSSAFFNFF